MPVRTLGVALERSTPQRLPMHPASPHPGRWRRWALQQDRPRAVDLFSGAGGMSLGLEEAGYAVVLSADNDDWCLETHRHNLPGLALDFDLSDPERVDRLVGLLEGVPIELIAGGPPCQPFSRAGQAKLRSLVDEGARPERDERSELWQVFLEVVERIQPRAVLMENVPDMALGDDLSIVREMTDRLETQGYGVDVRLLDAWRYGVPQHRQRLFLAALQDGRPVRWPARRTKVDLREAIGDLPALGDTTGDQEMQAREPRTAFQRRARAGMNGRRVVWDHVTRPVRADDREAFRLMKPGTRYSDLPEHLRRYRSDIFDDKYNRLAWDGLCRSITAHIAKDGYWYIHPSEHRTLTVREAARVQTFPDRFRFAGSRSHAFRQIGNAVPPALAAAVGRALLKAASAPAVRTPQRAATRLARIRARLLDWAERDRKIAPWRHPGSPWQVLAGVVLIDRAGSEDIAVASFLERFPTVESAAPAEVRRSARGQAGGAGKGHERMARAARTLRGRRHAWRNEWSAAAGLGPGEESFVRTVGLGEDRVIVSAPILRVVGRLTGVALDGNRRHSDGRILVGRVLGAGDRTPELTAALHALGRRFCTPDEPGCARCPIRRDCEGRR